MPKPPTFLNEKCIMKSEKCWILLSFRQNEARVTRNLISHLPSSLREETFDLATFHEISHIRSIWQIFFMLKVMNVVPTKTPDLRLRTSDLFKRKMLNSTVLSTKWGTNAEKSYTFEFQSWDISRAFDMTVRLIVQFLFMKIN